MNKCNQKNIIQPDIEDYVVFSHWATVGLSIESANVVGYLNKDVRQYLSQQVCTFDQIGVEGGALDLQNLIPVDENGDAVGEGDVTIQFISDRGALVADYAYYLADEMDEAAGWYDGDGNYAEVTLNAGEAFQISAIQAVRFVYSGEVNLAETDVPFRRYLSVQANIRPASVDIQSILPVDAEDEVIGGGDVTIQFISNRGALVADYAYYLADEMDEAAGWYDGDGNYADYTFAPGEGFKLSAMKAGYLRFPEM